MNSCLYVIVITPYVTNTSLDTIVICHLMCVTDPGAHIGFYVRFYP
jgi:hypothetical protein